MLFDTGRYLIKNADNGNLATLPDANKSSNVVGSVPGLDDNLIGEKVCSITARRNRPQPHPVEYRAPKQRKVQEV